MKEHLSKYWYYYFGGAAVAAGIGWATWYFAFAPPWTGLPCAKGWTRNKWQAFRKYFEHNHSADGQDPEWYRWMIESIEEPHYSRSDVDKSGICDAIGRNAWKETWEEFRAVNGLRPDGSPMKEGEKWAYQGPKSCLRGFSWDRYLWIKRHWIEMHEGLYKADKANADSPEGAANGARWLWMTAGDGDWAESFGSGSISLEHICKQLQGKRTPDDFWPNVIEHTKGVEHFGALNNPDPEQGGTVPGEYAGSDDPGNLKYTTLVDLVEPPARGGKSDREILKEAFTRPDGGDRISDEAGDVEQIEGIIMGGGSIDDGGDEEEDDGPEDLRDTDDEEGQTIAAIDDGPIGSGVIRR